MKFRNISGLELDFKIDSARFQVGVGELVDIPDAVAYCVKLHGLPLKPHEAPELAVVDEPKAKPKAAKSEV